MIEADKRKAIFLLHQEGMPLRQIARRLHVSRNTVGVVIAQGGQLPKLVRSPKQKIDSQLLQRLYEQCGGWIQRMHEKLAEEEGIEVKYSCSAANYFVGLASERFVGKRPFGQILSWVVDREVAERRF